MQWCIGDDDDIRQSILYTSSKQNVSAPSTYIVPPNELIHVKTYCFISNQSLPCIINLHYARFFCLGGDFQSNTETIVFCFDVDDIIIARALCMIMQYMHLGFGI